MSWINVSQLFVRRGKYLQHIVKCEGCFFSLYSHAISIFYVPSGSSQPPTHMRPHMQKPSLFRILCAVKDFLWYPKILTSQNPLQLHCRPQPGPVKNVRLVLTQLCVLCSLFRWGIFLLRISFMFHCAQAALHRSSAFSTSFSGSSCPHSVDYFLRCIIQIHTVAKEQRGVQLLNFLLVGKSGHKPPLPLNLCYNTAAHLVCLIVTITPRSGHQTFY